METVAYLGDAQFRDAEKERSFHQEHLVDIVDNCAATDLTDYAGEINCRDMELVGIERDVMVFRKVLGQQS